MILFRNNLYFYLIYEIFSKRTSTKRALRNSYKINDEVMRHESTIKNHYSFLR